MSIYTKNGDEGFTRRIDGESISKCDPRIEAVGAVDELNSNIGLCACIARQAEQDAQAKLLGKFQEELFVIGTHLTTSGTAYAAGVTQTVPQKSIAAMEEQIDEIWAQLGPLKSFILPGGCELACHLHVARTLCRRAERAVAAMQQRDGQVSPVILRYLNRLSDLLFALARQANAVAGLSDVEWHKTQANV